MLLRRIIFLALIAATFIPWQSAGAQTTGADVAAYQLGVTAEVQPGTELIYSITVTNYGPGIVSKFYIEDGWTVNAEGISAFAAPIADPDFGSFKLAGTWEQSRTDQNVLAWLLDGTLNPGDTVQFKWKVQIAENYQGGLVNWAQVRTSGAPNGSWQPRRDTTDLTPPAVAGTEDPDTQNNRTPDGVTVVTTTPNGQGVDMAIYQAGFLSQLQAGKPVASTWLVTNIGPQTVNRFYLMAAWSIGPDKSSLLVPPVEDPDFGIFKVIGRWRQIRADEELWLWLLEGELKAGDSAFFNWQRSLLPTYRGDLVNWSRVFARDVPPGTWTPRDGTSAAPQTLDSPIDTAPDNDRTPDGLSTVTE
jgi:hypothetical protein